MCGKRVQLKWFKRPFNYHSCFFLNSGTLHLGSKVGIYACDPDAYTTFGDLFNEVIKAYHVTPSINHPTPTFGTDAEIAALKDIEGDLVISTRIRVARSHAKYPFPPACTSEVCGKNINFLLIFTSQDQPQALTLSQTTNFRLFQTQFADISFKFDKNGRKFYRWVENTAGKGVIARYEQFFLFLQFFQKTCTADM